MRTYVAHRVVVWERVRVQINICCVHSPRKPPLFLRSSDRACAFKVCVATTAQLALRTGQSSTNLTSSKDCKHNATITNWLQMGQHCWAFRLTVSVTMLAAPVDLQVAERMAQWITTMAFTSDAPGKGRIASCNLLAATQCAHSNHLGGYDPNHAAKPSGWQSSADLQVAEGMVRVIITLEPTALDQKERRNVHGDNCSASMCNGGSKSPKKKITVSSSQVVCAPAVFIGRTFGQLQRGGRSWSFSDVTCAWREAAVGQRAR